MLHVDPRGAAPNGFGAIDLASFLVGASAAGGLTFFFDPSRGRTRRALVRDQFSHARRATREATGVAYRDLRNRAVGVTAKARQALHEEGQASDEAIAERVRAALRASCSHPRAIDVAVRDGIVELRGPVLSAEADDVRAAAGAVHGARELHDELETHDSPGSIPALQGGPARAPSRRWTPASRALLALGLAAAATPAIAKLAIAELASKERLMPLGSALCAGLIAAAAVGVALQERQANRLAERKSADSAAEEALGARASVW